MIIRLYDPTQDETSLLQIWKLAYPDSWSMTRDWLRIVIDGPREGNAHYVSVIGGQVVGFVLAQAHPFNPGRGSLMALGVHPAYRRRGMGRTLYLAALKQLQECGVKRIQLGSGSFHYFWPGVPLDLPDAWAFFQASGWSERERSFDLARSLVDYATPGWVWERVSGLGLELKTAELPGLAQQAIDFVTREEPGWAAAFDRARRENRGQDILLAYHASSSEVLGACLIEGPKEFWPGRLAQPVGAPGCILTAEQAQGQGIGMALTARATEIVQARGCRSAFLGWTWLVDWYGKLGYTVWQEYRMSWRELDSHVL